MPWKLLTPLPAHYAGGGLGWPVHRYLESNYPGPRLYVCCGRRGKKGGIGVDVRRDVGPSVVACAEQLPFRRGVFSTVVCDPPWIPKTAREQYGTDPVDVPAMFSEAMRVTRPGGYVLVAGYSAPPLKAARALRPAGVHIAFPIPPGRMFAVFVYRRRRTLDD